MWSTRNSPCLKIHVSDSANRSRDSKETHRKRPATVSGTISASSRGARVLICRRTVSEAAKATDDIVRMAPSCSRATAFNIPMACRVSRVEGAAARADSILITAVFTTMVNRGSCCAWTTQSSKWSSGTEGSASEVESLHEPCAELSGWLTCPTRPSSAECNSARERARGVLPFTPDALAACRSSPRPSPSLGTSPSSPSSLWRAEASPMGWPSTCKVCSRTATSP
eukprot:scaffold77121_cov27-Tisochrysis_lutea.AAC.5